MIKITATTKDGYTDIDQIIYSENEEITLLEYYALIISNIKSIKNIVYKTYGVKMKDKEVIQALKKCIKILNKEEKENGNNDSTD